MGLMLNRGKAVESLAGETLRYLLRSVVQGYFNYHAVQGNLDRLRTFRDRLIRLWRTQLRQRSQRHRLNWDRLGKLVAR